LGCDGLLISNGFGEDLRHFHEGLHEHFLKVLFGLLGVELSARQAEVSGRLWLRGLRLLPSDGDGENVGHFHEGLQEGLLQVLLGLLRVKLSAGQAEESGLLC